MRSASPRSSQSTARACRSSRMCSRWRAVPATTRALQHRNQDFTGAASAHAAAGRFRTCIDRAHTREKLESRVTIQSFDWRTLQVVQQEAPQITTVYLSAQQSCRTTFAPATHHRRGRPAPCQPLCGSVPQMSSRRRHDLVALLWRSYGRVVTRSPASRLKIVVWTVNEPRDIARMIELGVDGIISDYPDRCERRCESCMALPPSTPVAPERAAVPKIKRGESPFAVLNRPGQRRPAMYSDTAAISWSFIFAQPAHHLRASLRAARRETP